MRAAVTALLVLALAGCASASGDRFSRSLGATANPSKVIATELAFARMAREKGTWTAFRAYATKDALWPSPAFENVQQALKGVPDPAEPVVWGPDAAWSSCDGSFAVTTGGAVFPGGRTSRFLTVWQRQKDGEYRWVLDQGFDREEGYTETDMIPAQIAECPMARAKSSNEVRRGEGWSSGASNDGTLAWRTDLAADCTRVATVSLAGPEGMEQVFRRVASPPAAPEGQPAPSCS